MQQELRKFLDDGPPPIVFTLGSSAFWVAKDFYRDSIKAAQSLGERALLLIGHERNRPQEQLPKGVAAFEYAPFGQVLPRARVIVHQANSPVGRKSKVTIRATNETMTAWAGLTTSEA